MAGRVLARTITYSCLCTYVLVSIEMRPKPNVFDSRCLSRHVVDALAEKWALLLIHSLSDRPKRTGELRRHVDGISERMLIQTLRKLETFGFVSRHAYAEVPPRVEYRLTSLGLRLCPLVSAVDLWIEENLNEIIAARKSSDIHRSS